MEIFESFTPNVEPVSVDEAFLDVTGAKKLLGTGREIAAAIRAKVEAQEGITCSVGIAPSKFMQSGTCCFTYCANQSCSWQLCNIFNGAKS